ncbi:hypothetical protein L6E12_31975 [Actinokineospora sp. PR83]|uniref:hypothetical protein n=1 Tax=Actinokineospora sp. PR83 TaxID=2884908 RepID=UPI0027E0E65C|nr:hypothetical protein [Actinokineospora sp. PR83]MCG8920395.1 hypothetical protein [Actinokineospora sp. PR83]
MRGWVVAALVLLLGGAAPAAWADGGPVGGDLHVAQTLGDRELTVVVRRVDGAPAPVSVDVVGHVGTAAGELRLRVVPAGGRVTGETTVRVGGPGATSATLSVDRFGPWELELDDGANTARIPFTVPERVTPAWERFTYGGFVAAGLFLLLALGFALRTGVGRGTVLAVAGLVVAVTVAVTAALLSASIPVAAPPLDGSRPPVNMAVRAVDARAGVPVALAVDLTDASTGRPVDDLRVQHAAFVHLVLVSPSGVLTHVHPVRVRPGHYAATFTPGEGGRFGLSAELSRAGAGVQEVRATLDVAGDPAVSTVVPGVGPRQADGATVDVSSGPLVAGRAVTVAADFGGPSDLQPWLGMRGHLIVVGPLPPDAPVGAAAVAAPVWAHAHAMVPPTPGAVGGEPDETVAAYDPEVDFTFTFPQPGRYRLWFQAERGYRVITAPAVFDVPADPGGAP